MNFEYKVITEVAGQYNTGNGLFSLQDLGKEHHNKHRPPYFSEYLVDNINAKCALLLFSGSSPLVQPYIVL